MTGTLWLVATPIGNLGDITPRARETLEQSALVCCEDTRRTGRLLQHLGVTAQALAVCNQHTEHRLAERVVDELTTGHDVAVVSDAGTPGISDPGERLVLAAIDAGANVSAIPGACAAISALITSGLQRAGGCGKIKGSLVETELRDCSASENRSKSVS